MIIRSITQFKPERRKYIFFLLVDRLIEQYTDFYIVTKNNLI